MQPRERQVVLGLHAGDPQDQHPGGLLGSPVEHGRLSHPQLSAQHKRAAVALAGLIEQTLDRRDQLEAEVARGTQRLGRLVDDLLNLARLEANEPLRSEAVDLAQIGESLVAESRSRTPACISIAHDGPAFVVGDPEALTRVLRNLIDNAVHAGGDNGRIVVELQRPRARVRATVSDDGPGVPPDARERIFQGFVRLDGSAGTGLGLAIARAIAHQHHGSVTCQDCDTGARFTLELPAPELTPATR